MISEDSTVVLDPLAQEYQKKLLTVILNKPIGYVSGQPEKNYRPAVSLVTRNNRYRTDNESGEAITLWPIKGLAPAGRLDIDSSGLLVLTQDGRIAKHLISPQSEIEKEYLVRVDRQVQKRQIDRLSFGLKLDNRALAKARVELLDENYFRMVLTEGRKRQIRRMCESVGLAVTGLKRVRIGNVRLGPLPVGKWRLLNHHESF